MAHRQSGGRDGHSSGTPVARRIKQPTRMTGPDRPRLIASRHSYSVLLPVGFAVPLPSPETRCALTAPFHPYHGQYATRRGGLFSVALSLRLARPAPVNPRRTLSGTVRPWSPDFPPRPPFGIGAERPSGRLTGKTWRARGIPSSGPRASREGRLRLGRHAWRYSGRETGIVASMDVNVYASGGGRVSISARSVSRVEGSAMPSTRAGRKCRWKAVTTSRVMSS